MPHDQPRQALTPSEAEERISRLLPRSAARLQELAACSGAILRQEVRAERDLPPFDRIAMDGIAINAATAVAGQRRFPIRGIQAAGQPRQRLPSAGDCMEAMTGAVLPEGCDAVIPVERLTVSDGFATLEEGLRVVAGMNIHARGNDGKRGDLLLVPGSRLGAAEIAIAASAGMKQLMVSASPKIAVVSTGDELVDPGAELADYQIRRSNAWAVAAALDQHGFREVTLHHLTDDAAALHQGLGQILQTADVLILSGGVSKGRFDLVPGTLTALGVETVFHGVAQRPGRPMWFGTSRAGNPVFALPGNPVSTLACLARYVIPALQQMVTGRREEPDRVALAEPFEWTAGLAGLMAVRVAADALLRSAAAVVTTQGSGDYSSLAGTHGCVELPPGPALFPAGFVAPLYRW